MLGHTKSLIMSSFKNHVQLIGNLGKDLEIKSFENGSFIAKVPLATNEYYNNNKGERMQETQWHNVVAWGKLAENMRNLLKKGDEVAVQGKLVHRSYEDASGQTKYVSEVVVQRFLKLTKSTEAAA